MLYRKLRFSNKTLKQNQTPRVSLSYFYFRTGMKGPICFISHLPKAALVHGPKFRSYLLPNQDMSCTNYVFQLVFCEEEIFEFQILCHKFYKIKYCLLREKQLLRFFLIHA